MARCTEKSLDPLCVQSRTWHNPRIPCEADPVSLDVIPDEFALRFRQITGENTTILACRDVRTMKEWMERSRIDGHEFKDPVTNVLLERHAIDVINEHPFSQHFDVSALEAKVGGLGYHIQGGDFGDGDAAARANHFRDNMTDILNACVKSIMPTLIQFIFLCYAGSDMSTRTLIWWVLFLFIIYATIYLTIRIRCTE